MLLRDSTWLLHPYLAARQSSLSITPVWSSCQPPQWQDRDQDKQGLGQGQPREGGCWNQAAGYLAGAAAAGRVLSLCTPGDPTCCRLAGSISMLWTHDALPHPRSWGTLCPQGIPQG